MDENKGRQMLKYLKKYEKFNSQIESWLSQGSFNSFAANENERR